MANIKVDCAKMRSAADKIDAYIAKFDKNMKKIDTSVSSLNSQWSGEDFMQLKLQWEEIEAIGSTSDNMREALKAYAASVRSAANKYAEAQKRAENRANTLCK